MSERDIVMLIGIVFIAGGIVGAILQVRAERRRRAKLALNRRYGKWMQEPRTPVGYDTIDERDGGRNDR